jgi:hypothetical protein
MRHFLAGYDNRAVERSVQLEVSQGGDGRLQILQAILPSPGCASGSDLLHSL